MKTIPRAQAGSGIPLPRSKLPSPKPDPKNPTRGLPRPTTQIPASARSPTTTSASTSTSGSSSGSSSKDLLRDTTLRNQHQQLKGGLPAPRVSSKGHVRPQGVRSAFSSPRVSRKEAPRSKDTLDVCAGRRADNLQYSRSNDNQNFLCGNLRPQSRKTDNSPNLNSHDLPHVLDRGNNGSTSNGSDTTFPSYRSNNDNLRHAPEVSTTTAAAAIPTSACSITPEVGESCGLKRKRILSFSDEEMYTPEDLSPSGPPPETPARGSPAPESSAPAAPLQEDPRSVDLLREKQTTRVNMATVPPFRYR